MTRNGGWLLLLVMVLTACRPSSYNGGGRPAPVTPPLSPEQETYCGHAFLLLSTSRPPISYSLARIPENCPGSPFACTELEWVNDFPPTGYSPASFSPISWTPDGTLGLVYDSNQQDLLSFDPSSNQTRLLASGLPLVSDQIVWSPDGKWAAASKQTEDPYISSLLFLDPYGAQTLVVAHSQPAMEHPIGWLNSTELIYLKVEYSAPPDDPFGKKTIARQSLWTYHIGNKDRTVLMPSLDLRGDSAPALSPNAAYLSASVVEDGRPTLLLVNLPTGEIRRFNSGIIPVWSPDGAWLAAIFQDQSHYVVRGYSPSTGETRDLFRSPELPTYVWATDSKHLWVTIRRTDAAGSDTTPLYLVSLDPQGTAELPSTALTKGQYLISGMSIQPCLRP